VGWIVFILGALLLLGFVALFDSLGDISNSLSQISDINESLSEIKKQIEELKDSLGRPTGGEWSPDDDE
jgi:hypothetical protein